MGLEEAKGGGGFAATPFCMFEKHIFIEILSKRCPEEVPGLPGTSFRHLFDIFSMTFENPGKVGAGGLREDFLFLLEILFRACICIIYKFSFEFQFYISIIKTLVQVYVVNKVQMHSLIQDQADYT